MDLSKLNRRTFLQASAAAGLAAVVESSAAEGLVKTKAAPAARTIEGETKIVKTCCRACIHNCAVLAHVRNGRVVKLEGNPDYPMSHGSMCAKGLAGISALYHPNRNKYPLMRVGKRGENKWKRISWKEAIDTIAGKMEEVRREYGAESVLFSTGGGGNPAFRGIPRVANAFGTPNFYEPGCAQCFLPRTLAYHMMYGGPTTSIADEQAREVYNPNTEMKCLVMWGTDVSYSCPAGVALGVATDQNENSVEAAMGSVILNALRGNVESPGALMQRNPSTNIVPAGSLATRCSYLLPKGQLKKRLGSNEHKGLMQWDAAQPSAVLEAMKTGKPYPIKVWLERSGNKFVVNGHAQDWIEGTKNVDLIVHMFLYPTSFSCYADILLPATEWLETNMLVECLNWVFARQPVAHVWETEDETLFWSKLIKKCAELGNENARRACDPAFMKKDLAYWDSMEELLDGRLANIGMTWKEFKEKQPFPYMPYDKWNTYYVYKQPDKKTGLPKGFGTPSKKLELYGEVWIELGRTGKPYALDEVPPVSVDYDPLPWYAEPAESPLRDIAKEFPLVLTNGRLPMFHHGTLRNNPYMRELYPVSEAWVNPVDAKKYGVAHDDWIWLESKRGKIRGKCRVTEGIPVGVVYMERFWFPETLNTKTQGWREMNVNMLSKNDAPFNRIVGTITLRGFQIRIRKASEGAPEGVWMKPEQFKAWLPQPTDTTKNPEL